jgi:L-asparaginase II
MSLEEEINSPTDPASLVEVWRGRVVESRHRGHAVAVDGAGETVASLGDPESITFMRSSAKPFQAIPLVASGAADRFKLTDAEIAIACGSHDGTPAHTETALSILRKVGCDVSDLRCGAHEPYSKESAEALRERGEEPTPLHNNCSGKHAGMLALARYLDAPTEGYERPGHLVQRAIKRAVAQFAGLSESEIPEGIDGCSVPTFALPLRTMALMGARFAAPPAEFDAATREACRRIFAAMNAQPLMVEGEGELDTEVMRACVGRLISKVGAEGFYLAGVLPSERHPRGLALALKIADGDKKDRARPPAAVEALRQLGLLDSKSLDALAPLASSEILNHRSLRVGEVRANFQLNFSR